MLTLSHTYRKPAITSGLIVLVAAIACFVIIPQIDSFSASLQSLSTANGYFVAVAVALTLLASGLSAGVYRLLAGKRARLGDLVLVQLSGLLINRLLPAGIGGLGLNLWYLRRRKFSLERAGVIVAVNNSLGSIGHVLLVVACLIVFSSHATDALQAYTLPTTALLVVPAVIIVLTVLGYAFRQRLRGVSHRLRLAVRELGKRFRRQPQQFGAALGLSMAMTLSSSLSFWLCCLALQVEVGFIAAFFIVGFSVLLGTATPTPGGLGGVEAALFVSLVSQSVASELALAAVLLYRLASFWFGLIVGAVASLLLRWRLVSAAV